MSELRCECRRLSDTIACVRWSGPLDWKGCEQVDRQLKELFAGGVNRLAIDMSGVGQMSSVAFGLLVFALDATARGGGALVIAAVPASIMGVMRVLGLHQVFAFAATIEEAEGILQSTTGSA